MWGRKGRRAWLIGAREQLGRRCPVPHHSRTSMDDWFTAYFEIASREYFECHQHKEMICVVTA